MSCFVEFKDGKKFSEEYAKENFGKSVEYNPNLNIRADKSTMAILRQDGLVDTTDKTKYGVLSTTSNQQIKKQILKAYADGGVEGVRDLYNGAISKIEANPASPISKDRLGEMSKKANTGDAFYQAVIDELTRPLAERAAAAGVTEAEMEAYDNAEELPESVDEKIQAYKKGMFKGDTLSLYNNMRRVLRLAFPLAQRANVIIGEDGFFADAELVTRQASDFMSKAKERWAKLFGGKYKGLLRTGLKHWSRIVSMDNGLMKMGFAKGSAPFEIMWEAANRGIRQTAADDLVQDAMYGELLTDEKYSKGTKFTTGLKGEKIHRHDITFAEGQEMKLSSAEAISLYLTLRQAGVKDRAVYSQEKYDKAKAADALIKVKVGEHMEGGKKEVVVTEDTYKQVEDLVRKEFPEFIATTEKVMDMQYPKMNETMFTLTGQHLAQHDYYFPTFEATNASDAQVEARLIEDLRYTKERLDGVKVYDIRDAFSLMRSYIHSSNYYANMAVPLRNARVLYTKLKDEKAFEGDFEVIGEGYNKWLTNLETNKGSVDFGDIDKAVNKWYSRYYKGILGWNLPVVLKQPTSALHAWNFFGDKKYAKYVLDAYKLSFSRMKPELEELRKYNPFMAVYMENVAVPELNTLLKTGGGMNWGTFVNSGMGGAAKQLGSAYIDKSLELIRHFDLATRIGLWNASKEYVRTKYEITEAAGDVYWEQVASTFNQVNENTQQTFDLFHRSELGRSPNPFVRGFLMFTTQLQKHLSLMDKAVTNYALYGRKEDRANLIRTAASVLFVQSAMVALIDLGKDALLGYDDEDKTRKALASTLSNSIAILPGLNLFSSDIANGVFGEDLLYSRPVSTPIVDGLEYLQKSMNDAFDKDGEALVRGIWNEGSKYAGVPLAPFRQFEQYQKNKED